MIHFIHAADFHLDSPFAALSPERARTRRSELRQLPARLADYADTHGTDLVLLSGDLLDGESYRETADALRDALGRIAAPVFIAPGNHDWYGEKSPYASLPWPENVHVFSTSSMEAVALPELGVVVHGAAFTAPEQTRGLLTGFTAPADGQIHLGVLHGELDGADSRYNPITREKIAASGLTYLALGHIHKRSELLNIGTTAVAWPGCPEGRGFDELGEKGFCEGTIDDAGAVSLQFVPFAQHRYEILTVDITGKDPLAAVAAALPQDTARDLYRIILTGQSEETGVDSAQMQALLAPRFEAVEVEDKTRLSEDLWARAGEYTLRGLFLRELKEKRAAATEEDRETVELAARLGLAALDHRDF
ncbi:MAG: DNA repair exonuclease [Oscillibacter sp.]|jgi:DNA repair exonuclease SbcCD nuclease subunit|nr:DNA repair exonuclease [Oscillibacter sp.]